MSSKSKKRVLRMSGQEHGDLKSRGRYVKAETEFGLQLRTYFIS